MRNKFLIGLMIIFIAAIGKVNEVYGEELIKEEGEYQRTLRQDIFSLMMAYPNNIVDIERGEEGRVFLILASGKKLLYDDMKSKTLSEKLNNADLQDIMEATYPLEFPKELSKEGFDPGRFRNYELLNEVYGSSEGEVRKNLTNVPAPYSSCQFNKNNEAAENLEIVMEELKAIAKSNGKVAALINPVNGTFNYRVISGTGNLSPHGYGIAIDLNSNPKDYWKWASRAEGEERMLSYPRELVEVFENHNFVWGGKWGHFDTLHFEYRPEIIIKAKYFNKEAKEDRAWYSCIPSEGEALKYINIINEKLGE